MNPTIDILMVTHGQPPYTRRSLSRLLDSCDEGKRVWVRHNCAHNVICAMRRSLKSA